MLAGHPLVHDGHGLLPDLHPWGLHAAQLFEAAVRPIRVWLMDSLVANSIRCECCSIPMSMLRANAMLCGIDGEADRKASVGRAADATSREQPFPLYGLA